MAFPGRLSFSRLFPVRRRVASRFAIPAAWRPDVRRLPLRAFLAAAGLLAALAAAAQDASRPSAPQAAAPSRVVTLGGSVTEIVYALGAGGLVVGSDQSSLYPEAVTRLPRVGYYRATPVEGVLALRPDLVLASEQAGPPASIERLRELGTHLVVVPDSPSVDSLRQRIRAVAGALGRGPEGERMLAELDAQLRQAQAQPAPKARALVLMNRTGTPQAAGEGTAADAVLRLAGLENALAGRQQGYKPLTAESLAALAPDIVIVTAASLPATGGVGGVLALPGLAGTPAGRAERIVAMDDLLVLGLGPRLPQALAELKARAAEAMRTPPAGR